MRQQWEWRGWRSVASVAVVMTVICSSAAQAAPVNISLSGSITFAEDGNAFGLSVGDTVSLEGTYDDSNYDGVGLGVVSFGDGTGNTLQVTLGSIVLNETMDVDFPGGDFPVVFFQNGDILAFDLLTVAGSFGAPADFQSFISFAARDEFGLEIGGDWDVATLITPEPGSLALAGIAAVACGAVMRRRRSMQAA